MSRVDWDFLRRCLDASAGARVVALGNFPSRVLRTLGVEHQVIPHPSGLNHKINDAREVARAIAVLGGRA